MIIALNNRQELTTLHTLKSLGLSISTVRGRRLQLNVAREIPVLTDAVLFKSSKVDQIFDWLLPEHT